MEEELNLLALVRALVERLMLSTEVRREEIEGVIAGVRADLGEMRAQYEEPAPSGAEAVQELMLETLSLYDDSLQQILAFLDDSDEERLHAAVFQAEEASDILSAIEDIIQTNKSIISEMVSA